MPEQSHMCKKGYTLNYMEQTPKHVAMQLGALITLVISLSSLLILLFGIINITIPDSADSWWEYESATEGIRYAIAAL
ncbi:MAG: hypothetical protein AAFO91_13815, partial [Bacteroidota bacterium]